MTKILQRIKSKLMHYTWDIAISIPLEDNNGYKIPFSQYTVLKNPYKDKWFADPFVLSYDGEEVRLLVEEFDKKINRGRIALLIVDLNKALIKDCKIVLDINTHLSYPAIYRVGEKIYVTPENADSGGFNVYLWNDEEERLEFNQSVANTPFADATILMLDENYYLFTTCMPSPNGNVLNVYSSQNIFSGYNKLCDVVFENNIARMAGAFFVDNYNQIIRPAQDCNIDYGNKVLFQILEKKEGSFIFKTTSVLSPSGIKYAGIHTFNTYKGIQIIDLKKYDFPILYKLKKLIKG